MAGDAPAPPERASQRIDKWLFFARLAKSRTLAARMVEEGRVRVNRDKIDAASRLVRPGDVLTVALPRDVLVLRVLQAGARRGPAAEARRLYETIATGRDGLPT